MSLPLATTTISVQRVTADLSTVDPYEVTAAPETVASGVRAHIGDPSGSELVAGAAAQQDISARLDCDPIDLHNTDVVVDDLTGETYEVVWTRARAGFGLDHTVAGLRQVTGATP